MEISSHEFDHDKQYTARNTTCPVSVHFGAGVKKGLRDEQAVLHTTQSHQLVCHILLCFLNISPYILLTHLGMVLP